MAIFQLFYSFMERVIQGMLMEVMHFQIETTNLIILSNHILLFAEKCKPSLTRYYEDEKT